MKSIALVIFFFTGTLAMMGFMRWHGKPLTQILTTPTGILSLEFAKTKQRADEVTTTWSKANLQQHAVANTWFDFVFIFFYSLFLFGACYGFSLIHNAVAKKISRVIALLGLTAGLLDITENFFLFRMLDRSISNAETNLTWWLAVIKFSLAGIAAAWILINLVLLIIPKHKTLSP